MSGQWEPGTVEDAGGDQWVRTDYAGTEGAPWLRGGSPMLWRFYSRIAVVQVLSEGVTA